MAQDQGRRPEHTFHIQIDRNRYEVTAEKLMGAELRGLTTPPVPENRDLYRVRPGQEDELVTNDMVVEMRDGLRFFTAPGRINPGAGRSC